MLTIRRDQMRRLDEAYFECWMISHLQRCFQRCQQSTESALRAFIRVGINRARVHDLPIGPSMCQFIDLMMIFGSRFDRDPRLPWAGQALAEPGPPLRRAARLRKAALDYLRGRHRDSETQPVNKGILT